MLTSDQMFSAISDDTTPDMEPRDFKGQFSNATDALAYMRAGNATVTLRSKLTGSRFTYRIREKKIETGEDCGPRGPITFISLLVGNDNENSYSYLGHYWATQNVFWHGRKSKISSNAPSAKAFEWTWRQLVKGALPDSLEIWHEGSCGRCGRKLTVPQSVAQGFGPECVKHIGG